MSGTKMKTTNMVSMVSHLFAFPTFAELISFIEPDTLGDTAVIFGGAGYIGRFLADYLVDKQGFSKVYCCDIQTFESPKIEIQSVFVDVRQPVKLDFLLEKPTWIFNLAAIHREPGHQKQEYFETNIAGANNVNAFAEAANCDNIFFTSSIAVYGPTTQPMNESMLTMPNSPYGISKLASEYIHQNWLHAKPDRRLVVVRPAVIYGPNDPGNVYRLINALRNRIFFMPNPNGAQKSYGYIFGLLESIEFMMNRNESFLIYNYAQPETLRVEEMIERLKATLNLKARIIMLPTEFIIFGLRLLKFFGISHPDYHPVRVKKLTTNTCVEPQNLIKMGFKEQFDLQKSIKHWLKIAPKDFE